MQLIQKESTFNRQWSHSDSSYQAYLLLIPQLFILLSCCSPIKAEWECRKLLGACLLCRLGCAALFEVPCSGLYLYYAAGAERVEQI